MSREMIYAPFAHFVPIYYNITWGGPAETPKLYYVRYEQPLKVRYIFDLYFFVFAFLNLYVDLYFLGKNWIAVSFFIHLFLLWWVTKVCNKWRLHIFVLHLFQDFHFVQFVTLVTYILMFLQMWNTEKVKSSKHLSHSVICLTPFLAPTWALYAIVVKATCSDFTQPTPHHFNMINAGKTHLTKTDEILETFQGGVH